MNICFILKLSWNIWEVQTAVVKECPKQDCYHGDKVGIKWAQIFMLYISINVETTDTLEKSTDVSFLENVLHYSFKYRTHNA